MSIYFSYIFWGSSFWEWLSWEFLALDLPWDHSPLLAGGSVTSRLYWGLRTSLLVIVGSLLPCWLLSRGFISSSFISFLHKVAYIREVCFPRVTEESKNNYNLILEVTYHWFCHMLLALQTNCVYYVEETTLGVEITKGFVGGSVLQTVLFDIIVSRVNWWSCLLDGFFQHSSIPVTYSNWNLVGTQRICAEWMNWAFWSYKANKFIYSLTISYALMNKLLFWNIIKWNYLKT